MRSRRRVVSSQNSSVSCRWDVIFSSVRNIRQHYYFQLQVLINIRYYSIQKIVNIVCHKVCIHQRGLNRLSTLLSSEPYHNEFSVKCNTKTRFSQLKHINVRHHLEIICHVYNRNILAQYNATDFVMAIWNIIHDLIVFSDQGSLLIEKCISIIIHEAFAFLR